MYRLAEAATVLLLALPPAVPTGTAPGPDPDGLHESSDRLRTTVSSLGPRAASLLPRRHELARRSSSSTVTVHFAFDSSTVRAVDAGRLTRYVDRLPARMTVLVAGHADRTGPSDYNVALSQHRTRRVADILRWLGLGVIEEAFGERCPAAHPTGDPHPRRWDRRVTVSLRPPTPADVPCPPVIERRRPPP